MTREILILDMWFMEKKVIIFRCRIDIRDKPARPEPAKPGPVMTLFHGPFPKFVVIYEIETFTQQRYWPCDCLIKFS